MPAAIVSLIATDADVLGGVTAVTLTDAAGTYGIRQKLTRDVVVPAGTPLAETSPGLWEYVFAREDGQIYECALEIQSATGTLRVVQDVLAAVSPATDSESASVAVPTRSLEFVADPATRVFVPDVGELLELTIRAVHAAGISPHVFVHQQRPADPKTGALPEEDFLHVASPFVMTLYPLDRDPAQIPGFYRKDTVTLRAASSAVLEYARDAILAELPRLLADYARLDRLYPTAEVILDGSGDTADMPLDALDLADPAVTCPAVTLDDQPVLAAELAAATGDIFSLSE